MIHWQLFVSHSGAFGAAGSACLVGGLLVEAYSEPIAAALEEGLTTSFPYVRYPARARYLATPISRVVETARLGAPLDEVEREIAPLCREARDAIRVGAPGDRAIAAFDTALDADEAIPIEAVEAADGWLRDRHRAIWDRLQHLREEQHSAFLGFLRSLARAHLESGARGYAIAAYDNECGGHGQARYLEAIGALFRRVVELRGSTVVEDVIVIHPVAFDGTEGYLGPNVLEHAFAEARERVCPRARNPLAVAMPPGRGALAGMATADFLAHELTKVLRRDALSDVHRAAARYIEVPFEALALSDPAKEPLPCATAVRAPPAALHDAAPGLEQHRFLRPRWKDEQAAVWARAKRRICAEGRTP